MARVWPAETMPSATERWSVLAMFETVRKVPPSIVTMIQARRKTPSRAP